MIYWGGPDGYQEHRKSVLPTFCANSLTIHDFDNDGLLDIYATAYANGRFRDIDSKIFFQTPDRMFHQENFQNVFNHSGCGCLAGDFNGDGYVDLAVASHKNDGHHVTDSYVFWGGPDGINENRYTALPGRGPHGMCSVDIGNLMDRGDEEFYYSEAYQVPAGMTAVKASWEATMTSVSNWVTMQVRCADSVEEVSEIAKMGPNLIVAEPTELIGTGVASDMKYVVDTIESVRRINPDIMVLQGAGISGPDDVANVIRAGAQATGCTSGIMKAADPEAAAEEMLWALRKTWDEVHGK